MTHIIAINGSPRKGWNTDLLVEEAARGAAEVGATVEKVDLYKLEPYTGCISCFGCKRERTFGHCIVKDGLTDVLAAMETADGIILGSPNYLGDVTAQVRALFERIIFSHLTYNLAEPVVNAKRVPTLLIMTSNAPDDAYVPLMQRYQGTFSNFVGPTEILCVGETLQVKDYSKFNWTMFDGDARHVRREQVFPGQLAQAFEAGKRLAGGE